MLLTFGRSAFAMPPISGVVLAAGSATGSATCAATAKAYKNGSGNSVGVAAPTAAPQRTVFSAGASTGVANRSGTAKADKNGSGGSLSRATPAGTARCAFNSGAGASTGQATPVAAISRRVKVAGGCFCDSGAEGEAQNWALAVPLAANAVAVVWGTFHQVARGGVAAGSSASAIGLRTTQPGGAASTRAVVAGGARLSAAAAGATRNNVIPIGAARRKSGGVGYQDAFGAANCVAQLTNSSALVNPTLQVIAVAVLIAEPEVAYAAAGAAVAEAVATSGDANLLPTTQLGGVTVTVALVGSASTTCFIPSAMGACVVHAAPAAAVSRLAGSGGVVFGLAVEAADATIVRLAAGEVLIESAVSGAPERSARAVGQLALAVALTDAGVQINPLSPSTFVIEVEVPDTVVEAEVPDNIVMVDAIDTLVEAA